MLYGASLTVPYDESASRVYVVYEVWSRAAKQVGGAAPCDYQPVCV